MAIKKTTEGRYVEAVGRRKTSTARVRLHAGTKGSFTVNDRDVKVYFPTEELQRTVSDPFTKAKIAEKYDITVKASGGGIHSQAEAIRLGISRALTQTDDELRGKLKTLGFLKRDPRAKERRKFGLKKARKSPQWSKR
jgi:small subunit ribosomal protein S9